MVWLALVLMAAGWEWGWFEWRVGLMLMLVADLVAMFWVGLWQGITARVAPIVPPPAQWPESCCCLG